MRSRSAPVHIRRSLRNQNRAQRFTPGRKDPYASRSRGVYISFCIHLHPIRRSRSWIRSQVIEDLRVCQRTILLHAIPHPQPLRLRIVDIEIFLVRRKRNAIRPRQVLDQQLQLIARRRGPGRLIKRLRYAIHAIHLQLLDRVAVTLRRQPIGRISKVKRPVGLVNQIIRTIKFLALIRVRQHRDLRTRRERLQPPHITLRMPCHCQTALRIERHTVRARLLATIWSGSLIPARLHEDAHRPVRRQLANTVAGDLREQKITRRDPDGALDPGKSCSHPLDHRVCRNDRVDARVQMVNLQRTGNLLCGDTCIGHCSIDSSGLPCPARTRIHYRDALNQRPYQDHVLNRFHVTHEMSSLTRDSLTSPDSHLPIGNATKV